MDHEGHIKFEQDQRQTVPNKSHWKIRRRQAVQNLSPQVASH